MRHQAPLPAVLGILLLAATPPADGASPARPEVFTPATCDAAETAALRQPDGSGPSVYRTDKAFGIVLNYYRFKRKQAVAVSREDVGAPRDSPAACSWWARGSA
ncbi:MAG: hypothetical protein HYU53_07005 [Acidobacteria bacterium]|nr:hypothetical protein [Acidobacteriota bacterium]